MINLLFYLERKKEQGVKLDVMHYMLSEMRLCVLKKRVPIYAPYLQLLIENKCGATTSSVYPLIAHKPLNMNFHGDDDPPQAKRSKPSPHDEGTSSAHPSSAPKTTWKSIFKNMNCFGIDMQKRTYEAHRNNKIIRNNQKLMARHMDMEFASGSEGEITPEETWVSSHSNWFLPPAPVDPNVGPHGPSTSTAPPVVNTQYLYGGDDVELPDPTEETMVDWFSSTSYVWPSSGDV